MTLIITLVFIDVAGCFVTARFSADPTDRPGRKCSTHTDPRGEAKRAAMPKGMAARVSELE
jgi:hypothetical protein